jgi:tetratricopeptide (TPR) repeat protein
MNAVYLEMVKMGRKWKQEVKQNPDAISFILLGQKPQNQLFETYCKHQLSDESNTDDIYLLYYQPFDDPNTYSNQLLEELRYVYQQWQKENTNATDWKVQEPMEKSPATYFINSLLQVLDMYPALKKNKIFIHLAPTAVSNTADFEIWITECGKHIEQKNAGNYIKLVFTDHENYRTIKGFYRPHYWEFPMDIANLMEKTAETTNQRKGAKETNFQQLILKAGNFLGKQQYQEADTILGQAVTVAANNKNKQGIILAKLLKAQNYQAQSKHEEAEQLYEQAVKDAKNDPDVLIQVYFSYGAFLLSQKQKEKALQLFHEVAEIGKQKNDTVLQIESYRLIGQINDSGLLNESIVIEYYEKCISLGKELSRQELVETCIPYIGSLLMKKYGEGSEKGEVLNQTMIELFDAEWEKKVVIPDLKNRKFVA